MAGGARCMRAAVLGGAGRRRGRGSLLSSAGFVPRGRRAGAAGASSRSAEQLGMNLTPGSPRGCARAQTRLHGGRHMAIAGEPLAPQVDSNHARLVSRWRDIGMCSPCGSPRSVEKSHIGAARATHAAASNAPSIADAPAAHMDAGVSHLFRWTGHRLSPVTTRCAPFIIH